MRQSMRLCVTNICALYRLMQHKLCLAFLRIFLRIFRFGLHIFRGKVQIYQLAFEYFLSFNLSLQHKLFVCQRIDYVSCNIFLYHVLYNFRVTIIYIIYNLLRLKSLSSLTFYFSGNLFNRMKSQYITRINLITRIS